VKKHLLSILCFVVAICTLSGPAAAAPIVQDGTTYTFYLAGSDSDNAFFGQTIFDDVAATSTRAGLLLTVSESELALGEGRSRIRVNIAANGDLFPSIGETVFLAIGADGDGFDLLGSVLLDEVRITFSDIAGNTLLVSDNLATEDVERNPWTGFFPAPANAIGFDSIGGQGASNISFDFFVTEITTDVPEPSTALLGMIGLAGAFAARRRQRKPATRA
jgi:hypothetical protein